MYLFHPLPPLLLLKGRIRNRIIKLVFLLKDIVQHIINLIEQQHDLAVLVHVIGFDTHNRPASFTVSGELPSIREA